MIGNPIIKNSQKMLVRKAKKLLKS